MLMGNLAQGGKGVGDNRTIINYKLKIYEIDHRQFRQKSEMRVRSNEEGGEDKASRKTYTIRKKRLRIPSEFYPDQFGTNCRRL